MNREPKLIGKSPHIRKLRHFIKKAAYYDANVLLLGETGVGKEVAARLIHCFSDRKNNPFIKINCANLNDALIESELFGHKKGSFTGAVIDKPGLIEMANGGTFFFDEIADITPYLQAKFLSVIEDKELRRLGENRARNIDVRFILATNKVLPELVEKGKFKKDLYYRINILSFNISPLWERKEDIPLLVESLLEEENKKWRQNKKITLEALNKLLNYNYPGNIRELENIIKRAYIFSKKKEIKKKEIIFNTEKTLKKISKITTKMIKKALKDCRGNKTRAAEQLRISRQWLYKLINKKKL